MNSEPRVIPEQLAVPPNNLLKCIMSWFEIVNLFTYTILTCLTQSWLKTYDSQRNEYLQ